MISTENSTCTCIQINKRCQCPSTAYKCQWSDIACRLLKVYLKWIQFCHILQFLPSCCKNMFFTAPALLLRFTFFCVGIFIGNLPETRYFLLAFYRYFRVILDSVIFLRPWWQPCNWSVWLFLLFSMIDILEFCRDGESAVRGWGRCRKGNEGLY